MSREREIVSDTGPLITLEKLPDGFRFIRTLYDRILVPPSVLRELAQGYFTSTEAYLAHYAISDLIDVVEVNSVDPLPEWASLDIGERDAIRLATEQNLPLLIEEEAGRAVARRFGLTISGIAGQILRAFRNDDLDTEEAVQKLRLLYDAGRINRLIYEGLTESVRREA